MMFLSIKKLAKMYPYTQYAAQILQTNFFLEQNVCRILPCLIECFMSKFDETDFEEFFEDNAR